MLVTLKKDEFLSNQVNKQKFINLLSENLEHAGYSTRHAKGDADVMIVDTTITKARDQTTVLIGEDTDLLVQLLYHAEMDAKELFFRPEPRQRDMTVLKLWDIMKTKTVLGRNVTSSILFVHVLLGCDTTSRVYGIGKGIALKKAKLTHNSVNWRVSLIARILQERTLSRPGRRLCCPYSMLLLLKA